MLRRRLEFDPRSQLLLLVVTGFSAFQADRGMLPWIVGFVAIYLLIQGFIKAALSFVLLAVICCFVQFQDFHAKSGLMTFILFFASLGFRLLPVWMTAYSLGKVPAGKMIASLRLLRFPVGLLTALAVSSRYFPVLRLEFEAIQMSAKLRGVSIASPKNWLRPLRTFEHTIVPLLLRSLKFSDELAASATTKGIDYPGKKTSLYPIAFQWRDAGLLVAYFVLLTAVFLQGGMP